MEGCIQLNPVYDWIVLCSASDTPYSDLQDKVMGRAIKMKLAGLLSCICIHSPLRDEKLILSIDRTQRLMLFMMWFISSLINY